MDDESAIRLYSECRRARHEVEPKPRLATYVKFLDEPADNFWPNHFVSAARQDLRDSANFVNEFAVNFVTLRAWQTMLPRLPDQERFEAVLEFVHPVAYFCLGVPYALKGRLHRSIAAVSHLANEYVQGDWEYIADLGKSRYETARLHASGWKGWPLLRSRLGRLDNRPFRQAVDGFRNEFHHGSPRLVEFGVKPFTLRTSPGGGFALGVEPALPLETVVSALEPQCAAAAWAYDAYVDLVREQYDAMMANKHFQQEARPDE